MDAIHGGKVRMRPRWHFILLSALGVTGALILLLALVYAVSLGVLFLRASGAWFLPSFGGRGWFDFFRSLPWLLILLLGLFVVVLEVLVRRFEFVYKKPLLISVVGIVLVIFGGGFVLSLTPLHRELAFFDRHGMLPPPFTGLYRAPFRMHPDDVYNGTIVAHTATGFVMTDRGESTTSVIITSVTRLPFGEDFAPGDTVVVIGDRSATDTINAYGIRELVPEAPGSD
jgi:hypothetical protein